MTDVRTLLHDLAAEAPRGHGEDTADRVVDLHRAQDRRRQRWAGVAAGIAVVVAAVPALVPRATSADGTADVAAVAAGGGASTTDLYDLPTRGSLAGDDRTRELALSADWGGGDLAADPDGRHVAYLGEVPGDQVWALVLGLHGDQTVYAWFVDAVPDDDLDLQLVSGPDRAFPDTPMGLLDIADDTGPLVVVSSPGDEISYASNGSGSVSGAAAVWAPLTTEDGVAVADVAVADRNSAFAGYRVGRDGVVVYRMPPQVFDSREGLLPLRVDAPAGATDPAQAAASLAGCLTDQGYQVSVLPDGGYQVDAAPSDNDLAALSAAQAYCTAVLTEEADGD